MGPDLEKIDFNKEQIEKNKERYAHLKDKKFAIQAGIYNRADLSGLELSLFKSPNIITDIDYRLTKREARAHGLIGEGDNTYLISNIDYKNKKSEDFLDCTSLVVAGKEKEDEDNISFMSHQNPEKFLINNNIMSLFKADLEKSLRKMKDLCEDGTIDVVIVGGNRDNNYKRDSLISKTNLDKLNYQEILDLQSKSFVDPYDKYKRSVKFLSEIVFKELGFYPEVISGPNSNFEETTFDHSTNLYFDTEKRKVYQIRKTNPTSNNKNFPSSDIDDQVKKFN